jgi:hypothetical protein
MLVIKVYVTKKVPIKEGESVEKGRTFHTELGLIDEIHIQNTGSTVDGTGKDWHIYQIKKPEPDLMDAILHKRKDGYLQLARRALKRINKYRMFPELKGLRRLVVSYKDGKARVIWSTHQKSKKVKK